MPQFRQLGQKFKSFGRQLQGGAQKFGRQLSVATREFPKAYHDVSKVYSGIEKVTRGAGIPVVPDIFGTASRATGAIGDFASGDFSGGKKQWTQGLKQGSEKLLPLMMI